MKYETGIIDVSRLLKAVKQERVVNANKYLEKVNAGSLVGTEKLAQEINKLEMLIKCLLKISKKSD